MTPHQLPQVPLGLSLKDEATFENYYAGTHSEMLTALQQTANGRGEPIIYLCGTRGQGLTHLLQAACHEAALEGRSCVYLPLGQLVSLPPDMLLGLETLSLICIDDVHVLANHPQWEEAVFHLFNRVRDAGGHLIITGNEVPSALPLHLPDLKSRLAWGVVYALHPLSDDEKIKVLRMRAKERGITLSQEVAKYLLSHCPRHMRTLLAALDALDKASLAAQRRLTIPFVKEVLQI